MRSLEEGKFEEVTFIGSKDGSEVGALLAWAYLLLSCGFLLPLGSIYFET